MLLNKKLTWLPGALLLCLSLAALKPTPAFANSPPQAESVSPDSGFITPEEEVLFTAVSSDPDGANEDLAEVLFVIHPKTPKTTGGCYIKYEVTANRIYLTDDTGNFSIGVPPGETVILENTLCSLNCASISVSFDGPRLNLALPLRFKPAFSPKNPYVFLFAKDKSGATSDWQNKGRIKVDYLPLTLSVQPNDGSCQVDDRIEFKVITSEPNKFFNMNRMRNKSST